MKQRGLNCLFILFFCSLTLFFPGSIYSQVNTSKSFAGFWDTNYGVLLIEVSGVKLEGKYKYIEPGNKMVVGTIAGDISRDGMKVNGLWNQGDSGKFEFVLSKDGNFFSGKFWFNSVEKHVGKWNGKKKIFQKVAPGKKIWI